MADQAPSREVRRVARAAVAETAFICLAAGVVLLFIWFQRQLLLLAFAGILAAIFLRTISAWIERFTRVRGAVSYLATLLLLAGIATGIAVWLVPRFSAQFSLIVNTLPDSLHRIEVPLQKTNWGSDLIARAHEMVQSSKITAHLPQIATTVVDGIIDMVIIAAIGFFAALDPRDYREGALIMIPESKRSTVRRIVAALREQLKWWLFGQMFSMCVLGFGCAIGLWIFGVEMPFALGLITGVAVFVPYAGTIAAGVPSVLIALQRGPRTALYVLLFYTALHVVEGYLLTPFIQRKAVRLPPVLTILAQFLMWNVAGIVGVALAAPLTTAGLVLVKEVYLHVPSDQEVV